MDNELIKMSDCPEIRDRWEPKVGDRVWVKRHFLDMAITEIEGDNIIHVRTFTKGMPYWRNTRDELLYIPRIENMLEWLVPKHYSDWTQVFSKITHSSLYNPFDMPVKGAMALLMHLEHNKTWDGEVWIC